MRGVIQIRQHLTIRHLGDQLLEQLADIGVVVGVTLAEIELGRDRQIALLGQAAAQILNMFMDAEDFLHHQHDGERAALVGGFGDVGRQCIALGRDGRLPGVNALFVGDNRGGGQRRGGRGESPLSLF